MKKIFAISFAVVLMPVTAFAGNTAAPSIRPGTTSVAPPTSQVQAAFSSLPSAGAAQGASTTVLGLGGVAVLPGAYQAALGNGATPASDGTVEVTISGVTLKVDAADKVMP